MTFIRGNFQRALDNAARLQEAASYGVNNQFDTKRNSNLQRKKSRFEIYLGNLSQTGGKSFTDTIDFLNGLKASEAKEFAKGLAKYKTIEALAGNFASEKKGLGNVIFDEAQQIGKGIGPGELWISWLVEDAKVSGGSESFDILVRGKNKYEVKSYIGDNAPFRLGNAGAASKFQWLKDMQALAATTEKIVKIPTLECNKTQSYGQQLYKLTQEQINLLQQIMLEVKSLKL